MVCAAIFPCKVTSLWMTCPLHSAAGNANRSPDAALPRKRGAWSDERGARYIACVALLSERKKGMLKITISYPNKASQTYYFATVNAALTFLNHEAGIEPTRAGEQRNAPVHAEQTGSDSVCTICGKRDGKHDESVHVAYNRSLSNRSAGG